MQGAKKLIFAIKFTVFSTEIFKYGFQAFVL